MLRVLKVIGWVAAAIALVLGAVFIALQRPDIPLATLKAKYANAQSRYIAMPGGVRMHYRDQGDPAGPPVVLIHGFAASLHAWEPWAARLGDKYRVVTLDLPGHGLTEAPAGYVASTDKNADLVDALAERLKLGPYVVAGNSMGGGVAWNLALRHPDHIRGLVLVDAAGWPRVAARQGPPPLVFALMRGPVGRALLRNIDTSGMARGGLKSAYVDPALVTPALVNRYVEFSRAPGHRDILLSIDNRRSTPTTPATFTAIKAPTLVMHGEADALIPVADGRALAAAIPGARLITYPGVGHVPMEQIPDKSAADLRAFLDSLNAKQP
jgi:pimeloyl-ACP methyl ester carboxylesterase